MRPLAIVINTRTIAKRIQASASAGTLCAVSNLSRTQTRAFFHGQVFIWRIKCERDRVDQLQNARVKGAGEINIEDLNLNRLPMCMRKRCPKTQHKQNKSVHVHSACSAVRVCSERLHREAGCRRIAVA